ncbi:MAG: NAD(P)/FAD-dependent oxidoreductase [Myxococcales bacterium]|nr:NAD(P)/FAD-dependent oxidoreductase [Myxococcales bacterium]
MFHLARQLEEFGIETGPLRLDWERAVGRKDALVRKYLGTKAEALRERGIEWLKHPVRFLGRQAIEAGGRRLTARKVILATGSKPLRPSISGIEHTLDSADILNLKRLPPRLLVVGGGVIAMEFASIFGHVGSKVTVLEARPTILAGVDADLRRAIEDAAPGWNVAVHAGAKVLGIERTDGLLSVATEIGGRQQWFQAETVLMATGRVPRLDGLEVEKLGVVVERTGVHTNEYLETDAEGIYAVGDLHGRFQLTPIADYEGKLAARNAIEGNVEKADYRVVTQTIFTIPSASSVGLTEDEARTQGIDIAVSTIPFAKIGPAVIVGKADGFVKVVFERRSGQLIGTHIFGHEAEELIHEAALAMRARMTREQLLRTIPVHPSLSEGFFGAVTSAKTGHEESCCG